MKKLFLTIVILLGMTLGAFAEWNPAEGFFIFNLFNSNPTPEEEKVNKDGLYNNDEINALVWGDWIDLTSNNSLHYGQGGLFGRGKIMSTGIGFRNNNFGLMLPGSHGLTTDSNGTPVGSGIVVLLGLGAAYAIKKRREK